MIDKFFGTILCVLFLLPCVATLVVCLTVYGFNMAAMPLIITIGALTLCLGIIMPYEVSDFIGECKK